jgi:hypothetical protein
MLPQHIALSAYFHVEIFLLTWLFKHAVKHPQITNSTCSAASFILTLTPFHIRNPFVAPETGIQGWSQWAG